MILHNTDLRF